MDNRLFSMIFYIFKNISKKSKFGDKTWDSVQTAAKYWYLMEIWSNANADMRIKYLMKTLKRSISLKEREKRSSELLLQTTIMSLCLQKKSHAINVEEQKGTGGQSKQGLPMRLQPISSDVPNVETHGEGPIKTKLLF